MTLEERVEQLERHIARLTSGFQILLLVMVAGGVLIVTNHFAVPDLVKAKAFHVVTDDGRTLVKLEDTFGSGGGFAGTIATLNRDGQGLVVISVTVDGRGAIKPLNGEGQDLVMLGATEGGGAIRTLSHQGRNTVQIVSATQGEGMIDITNDNGQDIVRLGAGTNGGGRITTRSSDGKRLVLLGSDPESGGGAIGVFDPSDQMDPGQLVPETP